jgi:hypothetical protein
MVGTRDTRMYTSLGLWGVTPYIQSRGVCSYVGMFVVGGTNQSGEEFDAQVPDVSGSSSLKAYVCCECVNCQPLELLSYSPFYSARDMGKKGIQSWAIVL